MDRIYEFPGPSRLNTASQNSANLGRMENGGMPKFPHHPCELATLTSNDHNFLERTPIYVFLDSTKISLSLEFNKMMFLAKLWTE